MVRKSRILTVAKELFLEFGYLNISTDQIAKKAEVAKGTIFHHFNSKLELAIAVMDDIFNEELNLIDRELEEKTPEEKIKVIIDEGFHFISTRQGMVNFIVQLYTEIPQKKASLSMNRLFGPLIDSVSAILTEMGYPNPEIYSRILLSILDGLGFQYYLDKEAFDKKTMKLFSNAVTALFNNSKP